MDLSNSHFLVTGADGFIGKNLVVRLTELPGVTVSTFGRGDEVAKLPQLVSEVCGVIHLAGENRPTDHTAFAEVNVGLTSSLCEALRLEALYNGRKVPLVFTSSTQAALDNPYGRSKLAAEEVIKSLADDTGISCMVFRLPGVFGKWCRPNYNSVVATYCYNISRNLPIEVNDESTRLSLVYIDDVVDALISAVSASGKGMVIGSVEPDYSITLGELASQILALHSGRINLMTDRVGSGLTRALYATYVSYLPPDKFSYEITQYEDPRGVFVEMLKTPDSGQLSYFTAYPGITRGGHYHHTKTEKFLVIKGEALFRFRNLLTGDFVELQTNGSSPRVVDTVPGWTHDITNIGDEEMVVMLWANENFDRDKPDTIAGEI